MNARAEGERPLAVLSSAFRAALEWRLLTLWTLGALLPTLVAAIPIWRVLAKALDRSPRAAEFAARADALALSDVAADLARSAAPLGGSALIAAVLFSLLLPLLNGAALALARGERPLGFVELLQGGAAWYGRMLRIGLVSLVPLAMVSAAGAAAFNVARRYAERAIFEWQAKLAGRAALVLTLLVFAVLHASVEAGRAELGADESLRSGWRAWIRGVKATVRRPLAVMGLYLGPTVASLALASLFLIVRLRVSGATVITFGLGFVLTQLGVAAVGWGKMSRLLALTTLARTGDETESAASSAYRAVRAE